jgi:hypothetical protein
MEKIEKEKLADDLVELLRTTTNIFVTSRLFIIKGHDIDNLIGNTLMSAIVSYTCGSIMSLANQVNMDKDAFIEFFLEEIRNHLTELQSKDKAH